MLSTAVSETKSQYYRPNTDHFFQNNRPNTDYFFPKYRHKFWHVLQQSQQHGNHLGPKKLILCLASHGENLDAQCGKHFYFLFFDEINRKCPKFATWNLRYECNFNEMSVESFANYAPQKLMWNSSILTEQYGSSIFEVQDKLVLAKSLARISSSRSPPEPMYSYRDWPHTYSQFSWSVALQLQTHCLSTCFLAWRSRGFLHSVHKMVKPTLPAMWAVACKGMPESCFFKKGWKVFLPGIGELRPPRLTRISRHLAFMLPS